MNFTIALLGGLVLILPGLTGLMALHFQSGQNGARRIDLPITSTLGLVLVLAISLLGHFLGWGLLELGIAAAREVRANVPQFTSAWGLMDNPYAAIVRLAEGDKIDLQPIVTFLIAVAVEAIFASTLLMSQGVTLLLGGIDIGNQGWLFQKIILPIRHGLQPVAYVLTHPAGGAHGLGYRGVVVEARQNADGELKGLTLNGVETYVYKVPDRPIGSRGLQLSTTPRRPLTGVLVLEGSQIRNTLVHTIPDIVVDEVLAAPEDPEMALESEGGPGDLERGDA